MRHFGVSNRVTRSTESLRTFSSGSKIYRTNQFPESGYRSFTGDIEIESDIANMAGSDRWFSLKSAISNRTSAIPKKGGCSSVGRAVALQAIGQEIDSPQLHQFLESDRACSSVG